MARNILSRNLLDGCILLGLAVIAAVPTYRVSAMIAFDVWDVWFEGSLPRVYENMVSAYGDHSRDNVHPLFSLLAYPPTWLMRKGLDLPPVMAVRLVLSLVASLWISLMYLLLRTLNCRSFDALLLSVLGLISAAAIFWLPVPETYPFGSCSMLLALLLMNTVPRASFWWYVIINVVSVSVTVTNWMAGILATLVNHDWKRSLRIGGSAVVLVLLLSGVQKLVFPSAKFFFQGSDNETKYLLMPEAGGPINVITSLLSHSMVMPEIAMVKNDASILQLGAASVNLGEKMTTQRSMLGSGTPWAMFAVLIWAGLLCLGVWALLTAPSYPRSRLVLGLLLCGQVFLHLLYGEETFLYAIHVAPLLILMVGMATLTAVRPIVLGLIAILILTAGINNILQFKSAVQLQDRLRLPHQHTIVSPSVEGMPIR